MKNKKTVLWIVLILVSACSIATCSSGDPNGGSSGDPNGGSNMSWTAVTTSAFYDDGFQEKATIFAIAYGNGIFVATGNFRDSGGKIAYSSDNGVTWTAVPTTPISGICTIAYGNGKFVVGGYSGRMAYSSDGVTWTDVTNSTFTNGILTIAYGNNMFIAGGQSGRMATSPDGVTWSAITNTPSGSTDYDSVKAITFGNGVFVAGVERMGEGMRLVYEMACSSDGVTWTAVPTTLNGISAIAYGNGKFVGVGGSGTIAYSSDNGETWTAVGDSKFGTTHIQSIAFGSNKFVAGGQTGSKMAYSSDGVTWTAVPTTLSSINAIAFGNERFVAGGYMGEIAYSSDNY